MKAMRIVERLLLSLGLLLAVIAITAMVRSAVLSRTAVAKFDQATKQSNKAVLGEPNKVDFSLWESKRIEAYLKSLSVPIDTPLAVLRVPRLKIEVPVLEGTDEFSLNRGVGWIGGTARPGDTGNAGIAGHRDGFFRSLKDVKIGDTVEVETLAASHHYRVDEIEIVNPSDTAVLGPRAADSVTLITCYPFYFMGNAPFRFIVHASVVATNQRVKGSPNSQNTKH